MLMRQLINASSKAAHRRRIPVFKAGADIARQEKPVSARLACPDYGDGGLVQKGRRALHEQPVRWPGQIEKLRREVRIVAKKQ